MQLSHAEDLCSSFRSGSTELHPLIRKSRPRAGGSYCNSTKKVISQKKNWICTSVTTPHAWKTKYEFVFRATNLYSEDRMKRTAGAWFNWRQQQQTPLWPGTRCHLIFWVLCIFIKLDTQFGTLILHFFFKYGLNYGARCWMLCCMI